MLRDAAKNVGKPRLGINLVPLGRYGEVVHRRRPQSPAIGPGEQPSATTQGEDAQRSLSCAVGQANPTII